MEHLVTDLMVTLVGLAFPLRFSEHGMSGARDDPMDQHLRRLRTPSAARDVVHDFLGVKRTGVYAAFNSERPPLGRGLDQMSTVKP